mmetsp:Transcript_24275/g.68900  ORF Transcript_24275/g.68900 Transcript_24275/m.68900 type:complete len:242 (+) Transcript_24275:213-938(+)
MLNTSTSSNTSQCDEESRASYISVQQEDCFPEWAWAIVAFAAVAPAMPPPPLLFPSPLTPLLSPLTVLGRGEASLPPEARAAAEGRGANNAASPAAAAKWAFARCPLSSSCFLSSISFRLACCLCSSNACCACASACRACCSASKRLLSSVQQRQPRKQRSVRIKAGSGAPPAATAATVERCKVRPRMPRCLAKIAQRRKVSWSCAASSSWPLLSTAEPRRRMRPRTSARPSKAPIPCCIS